jgi:hypothetical protein
MALTARCSALRTGATVRPARLACSAVPRPVLLQVLLTLQTLLNAAYQ